MSWTTEQLLKAFKFEFGYLPSNYEKKLEYYKRVGETIDYKFFKNILYEISNTFNLDYIFGGITHL